MQRQQQQVDDLNVFSQEQALIQVAAKSFPVPDVPQMLLVHGGIPVGNQQVGIQSFVEPKGNGRPGQRSDQQHHPRGSAATRGIQASEAGAQADPHGDSCQQQQQGGQGGQQERAGDELQNRPYESGHQSDDTQLYQQLCGDFAERFPATEQTSAHQNDGGESSQTQCHRQNRQLQRLPRLSRCPAQQLGQPAHDVRWPQQVGNQRIRQPVRHAGGTDEKSGQPQRDSNELGAALRHRFTEKQVLMSETEGRKDCLNYADC